MEHGLKEVRVRFASERGKIYFQYNVQPSVWIMHES